MLEELLDVIGVGLVGEGVLDSWPLVADATDYCDGMAPILVEADVNELMLWHPERFHFLP